MPAKMPQPLGGVFSLMKLGTRLGLVPDPAKALQKPHDERLERVTPRFMCRPGPAADTEDVVVEGRGGPIPARVYCRPGTRPGAPATLFIHGGAFIDLGVDFCDNVQHGLAQRTGYVVVGLSYRLAPEHPFPPVCTIVPTCCSGCTTPAPAASTRSGSPSGASAPAAARGGRRQPA